MLDNLYLHIGPHKTGSTYIQKMLYENRDLLRDKEKLYFDFITDGGWGHHKLVESIYNPGSELFQQLMGKIQAVNGSLIISSENFDLLTIDQLRVFYESIELKKVKIIFLKRDFGELLISNWQEDIKHGSTLSWNSFLGKNLLRPFSRCILGAEIVLHNYCEVFGEDSLVLIDYHTAMASSAGIFGEFLAAIDEKKDKFLFENKMINKSISYVDIELIRILNNFYKNSGKIINSIPRNNYLKLISAENQKDELLRLKEIISENLEPFSFDNIFSIDNFEQRFFEKFNSFFQNEISNLDNKDEIYYLPDESWCFCNESMSLLSWLYKEVS